MLVFEEREKPKYVEKNLSEQSREPTNSVHIRCRVRESNPGLIGGRRALSPLRQPCSPECMYSWFIQKRLGPQTKEFSNLQLFFQVKRKQRFFDMQQQKFTTLLSVASSLNLKPHPYFLVLQQLSGTLSYLCPPYTVARQSAQLNTPQHSS